MNKLAIVALMLLIGAVVGFILPGMSRDKREPWTQLVAPPEPAIEILGRDQLTASTTFLRTAGGVYACGAKWEGAQPCSKVAKMPDPSELCAPAGGAVLQAPGEAADSLHVYCHGADVTISFDLVLLKDGRAFESVERVSAWTDVLADLTSGCMGGVVGLIVGIIIVVAMSMRKSPAGNSTPPSYS